MDAQINKFNGESFTFEQYGILVKDFVVSSIPLESVYGEVEGSDRTVDYGAIFTSRTITVPFEMMSYDLLDFPLLRDTLFGLVVDKQSFYIREMRRAKPLAYNFVDTNEPAEMDPDTDNQLVGGKRYLVRLQNSFELEQMLIYGEGELVLETTELPFAESIGTTQDIEQKGISANDELWGFGMGLIADDDSLVYSHSPMPNVSFYIYNAGNVSVHPFEQDLKVTMQLINGSNDFFQLENKTNGSLFRVNEGVTIDKTIVIEGANATSNGLQYLRNTNKGFLSLEPGWNEFIMTGAERARVEFDFRFYYL